MMADTPETIRLLKQIRYLCVIIAAVALFWTALVIYPIVRGLLADASFDSFTRLVFAGMVVFAIALLTLVGIPSSHTAANRPGSASRAGDSSF